MSSSCEHLKFLSKIEWHYYMVAVDIVFTSWYHHQRNMAINGEEVNHTKIHFFEIRLMQYNEINYDTKYLMLLIT